MPTVQLKSALAAMLGDELAALLIERKSPERLKEAFQGQERPLSLVSFDVDQIKEFVFTSVKPTEIRGASEMVRELTDESSQADESCSIYKLLGDFGLSKDNVIFAGGGNGLLIVPADKAEKIAQEIELRFARRTKVGSCTAIWHQFYPHELLLGPDGGECQSKDLPKGISVIPGLSGGDTIPFGKIVQLLGDELQEAKRGKFIPGNFPISGILKRCSSCGILPAWKEHRVGEEIDFLCEACYGKRQRGRKEIRSEEKELPEAKSINDIVGETPGEGRAYIGVIYADVNGMGRILSEIERIEGYHLFSQTVTKVMEKTKKDAVKELSLAGRYQSPVVGGDDVLLILPAKEVLQAVMILSEGIENGFTEEGNKNGGDLGEKLKKLRIGVGFVIVPQHFPLRFAVDYAEQLMRKAKELGYSRKSSCVDFMVIKDASPLNSDIESLRRELYFKRWRKYGATIQLTKKPYSLSDFGKLLEDLGEIRRQVPQSQLFSVRSFLENDPPEVARMNIAYQYLRSEDWKKFFLGGKYPSEPMNKWVDFFLEEDQKRPRNFSTSFLDLLEVYDFREVSSEKIQTEDKS